MDGKHQHSTQWRHAVVQRLAVPTATANLPLTSIQVVMSFRTLALCVPAGRDPLAELVGRLRSVTAAKAVIAFAEDVGRCWPESVLVYRPCCTVLSPDECTLAALVHSALDCDEAAFERVLDGFVRKDRHASMFASALLAVSELTKVGWSTPRR